MSILPNRTACDVFFALGDETRLGVVRKLGAGKSLSATALSDGAKVSRQAIAKHLRILEGAGLVTHARAGREVVYSLDTEQLDRARDFIERISAGWDRAIVRLRRLVATPGPRPRKRE
jgi:DNA-binding transcriptional ArsR family regulator